MGPTNKADEIVRGILSTEEDFLTEVGRFTLLFGRVEEALARGVVEFGRLTRDKELIRIGATAERLRAVEKRDVLKRMVVETGYYYGVDHRSLSAVLDDFGSLNRRRKAVVHGRLHWVTGDERPVFIDNRGYGVPAWPMDILNANLGVLRWLQNYHLEQSSMLRAVVRAYNAFAESLQSNPRFSKLSPELQVLIRRLGSDNAELHS